MDIKNILAHRGFWIEKSDQNSTESFRNARALKCGVELDVRKDFDGRMVISHDSVVDGDWGVKPSNFTKTWNHDGVVAIDIKEPGLSKLISPSNTNLKNKFLFDIELACPEEMDEYLKIFGPDQVACRMEDNFDYAIESPCKIVWYDPYFKNAKPFVRDIILLKHSGKKVFFVSPELHGKKIKDLDLSVASECEGVCTDFPNFYAHQLCSKNPTF